MSNIGAYLHCTPEGAPFYVGKGTPKRSKDFYTSRSKWHNRIVSKHGKRNIVVQFMECSTDAFALELEKGLITTLRRNGFNLCNIASGGVGSSGWKVDREIVARIAEKNRGRVQSAEERAMRSVAFTGVKKPSLSDAHKKKLSFNSKGKKWYTDGERSVFCLPENKPLDFNLGRLTPWFNGKGE